MVSNAGTFFGRPVDWTIENNANTCTPTFKVKFGVTHELAGEWKEIKPAEVIGYFYPLKKDKSANPTCIEMLKKALGWGGSSFAELIEMDHAKTEVQIVVKDEGGKLKVQWLNPRDHSGALVKAPPELVKSLDDQFGAVLRGVPPVPSSPAIRRPLAGPPAAPPLDTPF